MNAMSRMNYSLAQIESGMLRLKWLAAATRLEIAFWNHYWALKAGYRPDQPRVSAGNPDGGQWTNDGGGANTRLASADKPRLGRETMAAIALQLAKRLIDAYRSQNSLWDIFGHKDGTVTVTTINGMDIFGSNSNSPTYTARDKAAALGMRDILLDKYPDVMETDNIGRRPNDALFHAETTVLLRAARANGGTLADQTIEVHGDREMCPSCDRVLPLVGLELGNPSVTFVEPTGETTTMKNGMWIK
jgi:hypothetical protein